MKVALVAFSIVTRGGTQRQMLSLGQALKRAGHDVTVYTFDHGDRYGYPDLVQGLAIRALHGESGEPLRSRLPGILGGLSRKVRRKRMLLSACQRLADMIPVDTGAVNTHDDETYKVAYFFKKRNPSAVTIWTMNDPPVSYLSKGSAFLDVLVRLFNTLELLYERRFLGSVTAIAVLDVRNKKMAERYYRRPVKIVRSGLDFQKFFKPIHPRSTGTPLAIFSMGIGLPHRRFEDVVSAAEILRDRHQPVRVTIFSQSFGDNPYLDTIRGLIQKRKLDGVIDLRIATTGINDEELVKIYQEHDVFIFPNHPQTWGLAVFEAMAAGALVIVSETAGASEVLSDGKNAFIVPPCAPKVIAEKVLWCIQHAEEYEVMRRRGQEFVRDHISWDRYASSMLSIFG